MKDLRSSPNTQQLAAINAAEGPVLIIAGPGSGKTYTLVERIVHLITDKQVPGGRVRLAGGRAAEAAHRSGRHS